MRYVVRPISDRTHFTGQTETSPFTASWTDTLQLLDRELTALGADEVVFEVDVAEAAIRLDGMLRSDARAASPAVRVAFESKHGPLTYATDRYIRPYWRPQGMQQDWQHNIRAIALGLEALRKVDRYGITRSGEQYAGWKQIEARAAGMGTGEAARLLASVADVEAWSGAPEQQRRIFRAARAHAHPDRHGGDRTLWDQVEAAGRVLGVAS